MSGRGLTESISFEREIMALVLARFPEDSPPTNAEAAYLIAALVSSAVRVGLAITACNREQTRTMLQGAVELTCRDMHIPDDVASVAAKIRAGRGEVTSRADATADADVPKMPRDVEEKTP